MIVDIEDDIMDPVMQCTTLPSHSDLAKNIQVILIVLHSEDGNPAWPKIKQALDGDKYCVCRSRAQDDQESQIKMIQVKKMMQDKDLKNSKSKDKGSRSRSQSMNEQSHYKQEKKKTKTEDKQGKAENVKSHIFNIEEDNDKTRQPPIRMLSVGQERQHRRLSPSHP
ncbi:hypothetical protein Tco_1464762 [Tanacetum coccineum]